MRGSDGRQGYKGEEETKEVEEGTAGQGTMREE